MLIYAQVTMNFKVMKNGVADLGMKSPLYLPGPVEPHYGPGRYLTFEGFSVDQHGKQVGAHRIPSFVPKLYKQSGQLY